MPTGVQQVVRAGLCSGCGVCVAVAPHECLRMEWTRDGFYRAAVSNCQGCGACVEVCPSVPDAVQRPTKEPLGPMLAAYVGYSQVPREREHGSSGGVTTRVLKALLERQRVDGVIAVANSRQSGRLFEAAILRNVGEIEEAAGSKYYPIEFSQVLRELRDAEGRYALVGLPCVVRAVRRARERHSWLAARVTYLLGLVCGHTVTAQYTDLLAWLSGVSKRPLIRAEYRRKQGASKASDYRFVATGRDGRRGRSLSFLDPRVTEIWCKELLAPDACFACHDLFAVNADATFMDAWLPDYAADPRGTSIVIVRNGELVGLIADEAGRRSLKVAPICEDMVIASQAGVLARRKEGARALTKALRRTQDRPSSAGLEVSCLDAPGLWFRRWRARMCRSLLCGRAWPRDAGTYLLLCYVVLLHTLDLLSWPFRRFPGIARRTRRMLRRAWTSAE